MSDGCGLEIGPFPCCSIVTGDSKELAPYLPDGVVDLIFTDPLYYEIEDYRWLAHTAVRVLKPGGMVIAQVGSGYRFEAECAMRTADLEPLPLLAEVYPMAMAQMFRFRVFQGWKPHIWMSKGKRAGMWCFDRVRGSGPAKQHHRWGDSDAFTIDYIHRLTNPWDLVVDFFTGSGTVPAVCKQLSRHFLAFEIDPDTAEAARARIVLTPTPLPGFEQVEMTI